MAVALGAVSLVVTVVYVYDPASRVPPVVTTVFLAVYFVAQLLIASLRPLGAPPHLELVALAFANVTLVNALVLGVLWLYSDDPAYGVPAMLLSVAGTAGLLVVQSRRDAEKQSLKQTAELLDDIVPQG